MEVSFCMAMLWLLAVHFVGSYKYGGKNYEATASPSGSNLDECRRVALKALKVNESTCTHMKCTFGGIWNGGGGDGQKNLFVASFFFDRAAEVLTTLYFGHSWSFVLPWICLNTVYSCRLNTICSFGYLGSHEHVCFYQAGFANPNSPVAKVRPIEFEDAAKRACVTKLQDAKSTYPLVEADNLPYICMDLVYQFTLLVDGFGMLSTHLTEKRNIVKLPCYLQPKQIFMLLESLFQVDICFTDQV